MPKYNLLSSGSTKIEKSNKLSDEWFSRIIYLAPDDLADGKNTVCPYAKIAKCNVPCLNTAGMGKFINVQQSRIRKTLLFLNDQQEFMRQLVQDVNKFLKECDRLGKNLPYVLMVQVIFSGKLLRLMDTITSLPCFHRYSSMTIQKSQLGR